MGCKNVLSEITWFLLFLIVMIAYSFGEYVERKSIFRNIDKGKMRVSNAIYKCKMIRIIKEE